SLRVLPPQRAAISHQLRKPAAKRAKVDAPSVAPTATRMRAARQAAAPIVARNVAATVVAIAARTAPKAAPAAIALRPAIVASLFSNPRQLCRKHRRPTAAEGDSSLIAAR